MSFELFCKYWNPHQVEEVNCMLSTACRPQTSRNQKVDDAESPLSHHWSIRRMSMSWSCSAPWKLWASSLPPPGRGTQSCGHQPTVAPFAWQSNKAISFGAVLCLVAQSCLTLCNPMDYSPPGSSVHSMLQTRVLEWVAMPSSRGSSHLPHCRRILYHLTHKGKSKNTGVGTYPFSGGTSWPRNQTRVSCIAGRSWPTELPVEFLSISPKTLSPRFNPVPVYRGQILATIPDTNWWVKWPFKGRRVCWREATKWAFLSLTKGLHGNQDTLWESNMKAILFSRV